MAVDKEKLVIVGNIAGLLCSRIVTMEMLKATPVQHPDGKQLPDELVTHIATVAEQVYQAVYERCELTAQEKEKTSHDRSSKNR